MRAELRLRDRVCVHISLELIRTAGENTIEEKGWGRIMRTEV